MRDHHSIFSKSALQRERSRNESKVTDSSSGNTSTAQKNAAENPPLLRSKRNLRPTEKYVKYRSNLTERSHLSINQINANITKLISDPELQIQIDTTDNSPQCLLVPISLEAWQKETVKIDDRKTYIMATQQEIDEMVTNALKSKYTFRLQCLVNETWKYKVRLVACGYCQIAGHDFNETFAPTAKFKLICIVFNLAAIFDWELHGIDIENALLESDLEETIYMKLPVDTYSESNGKPVIVRLKKSLYGLKQAGELFYKLMKRILTSEDTGMKCCMHDMCVFTLFDDETNQRVVTS